MGRAVKYLNIKIPESQLKAAPVESMLNLATAIYWDGLKRPHSARKGVFVARLIVGDADAIRAVKSSREIRKRFDLHG